jgi:hypothetical protein
VNKEIELEEDEAAELEQQERGSHPSRGAVSKTSITSDLVRRLSDNLRKEREMKYLLLVCWDAERMDAQAEPEPVKNDEPESFPWLDDLQSRGAWIIGDQLVAPSRGRSVRLRGGKTLVTDGPFAATKEAVGGFDVIEAGSLEEAVDIAARHPVAEFGTIEVRQFLGS